ncbi:MULTISPECIES: acyl-CoA synthetase [unclassified Variovorax]|uniref:acyl-CoA synthetase n=1 Tax=unclassified Variovorax TaxID=663243 RepID=UPI00076D44E3|nr:MULTISPECIES: acyl-CoA synthetase [unclassified Variovorax]KWT83546.1 Long-chain-fatty-acid--CoA ligase [Variovorax sp. WDL1]PNG59602.1 Long-chain-fatty-acid--CoA ligase [Variovorax sp. B4]PNG60607.1 Long-chain-fatty-acid--CoA ligase [Variovorax sp. B2]VTV13500.1 Long-chain-fatty-acid--CoA ligase [Variovorax sp. WDL1]
MSTSETRATAAPFSASFPIRSIEDVRRLEQTPLAEVLTVRSTYEIFRNAAAAFGDKTALTFLRSGDPADEPIRWSYAQLLAGIHQTANLLHTLGVGPDDAVAILLPGCLDYHLALWGGSAAGIAQPLNPLLTDEKLVSLMKAGRAKVLVAWGADDDGGMWSKAMRLRGQVPTLATVLRVAPHDEAPGAAGALPEGVLDFAARRAMEPDDRLASGRDIAPADIAAYFHTGGTTGAPKLARHSHGAQVFTAFASVKMTGQGPQDITINGYPLFHVAGVLPASLASLSAGVEVIIPTTTLLRNRQVMANYWKLVEKHRPTSLSAVPTVLAALANVPLDGADISSIRYCRTGAAVLPPELAARFERLFGLHVHESLGMTEMAGISTITPPGVIGPPGCVGLRLPWTQIRIVALDAHGNASDQELPPGEQGMVLFKSPNLFSGFVDPADNAKTFTADGWLATGDLGWIDEEERLNLSGRSKDLIIRSGHNIDPKTIEDALGAHPAVQLCAAVGAPDAYAGELPVAFATLVPGATASEAELLAFTAARVDEAPAKPRSVVVIDQMPVTNVGKIFKPDLRALAARRVAEALVEEAWADLDLPGAARPAVRAEGEKSLTVTIDAAATGPAVQALQARLQDTLGRLPLKVQVLVQ